jgi:hypothetical protein
VMELTLKGPGLGIDLIAMLLLVSLRILLMYQKVAPFITVKVEL